MKNQSISIIFIRGAQPLYSKNKLLQKVILFLYKNPFNFIPQYTNKNSWTKELRQKGFDTVNINWDGSFFSFHKPEIYSQATEILKNNPNKKYIFLTESIGAEIAFLGIKNQNFKNLKGIIALCPVNKPREIKGFKMISIKSKFDKFERFSNKILWPFHSFKQNRGNFELIELENTRHDQFTPENKTVFNLVLKKIAEIVKN